MEEMAASIQTVAGSAQGLATYVEETSQLDHARWASSIEEVARSSATLAQHGDRGLGHHRGDDGLHRPDGQGPREPGRAP